MGVCAFGDRLGAGALLQEIECKGVDLVSSAVGFQSFSRKRSANRTQ